MYNTLLQKFAFHKKIKQTLKIKYIKCPKKTLKMYFSKSHIFESSFICH